MSVSTIDSSDPEFGKDCEADNSIAAIFIPDQLLDESERSRDIFQRSTLGRNAPNQFDQRSRNHRCGEYNITKIKAFAPFFDESCKKPWTTTPPMPVPTAKKKAIARAEGAADPIGRLR